MTTPAPTPARPGGGDLYRINPRTNRLEYNFHPGQAQAWRSRARTTVVCAGTQGGKTSFGPPWLMREMTHRGPGDYMVATPTYPLLNLKLLPEFRRLFEDTFGFGKYKASPVRHFRLNDAGNQALFGAQYPDTPTNVFFGHAQDPDSLESATAKGAWLDEAGQKKFRQGSYEAIARRLVLNQGRDLITTTPYQAFGWFKRDLHDPAHRGDTSINWIRFESRMNPLFSEEEWERQKARLPKWRFDLFYRALLTRPPGMIYDCWDSDWEIPPFTIPAHWPRYLGVDFGGINTCGIRLALDPSTEILYAYDEYHPREQRTSAQHVFALRKEPLEHAEPGVLHRVVGGSSSEGQWRTDFTDQGLPVEEPEVRSVEGGINRVYAIMQAGRLRVFDHLTGLTGEIETYSRVLDADGNPTDQIEDKEKFHHLDALRYISTVLEGGGYDVEDIL